MKNKTTKITKKEERISGFVVMPLLVAM